MICSDILVMEDNEGDVQPAVNEILGDWK